MAVNKGKGDIASTMSQGRAKRAARRSPGRPPAAGGPGLTRARVVEAAADLARREGFDAVNVRRLAQDLGVWAGAVSHHAPNKDDLLDEVVDLLLGACPVKFPESMDWRVRLHNVVRALAGIAYDYPGFADWSVWRVRVRRTRANGRAVGRVFQEIFIAAGLSRAQAKKATVAAHAMTLGAIKLSDAASREGPDGEKGWLLMGVRSEKGVRFGSQQVVDACVECLIMGVEAMIKPKPRRVIRRRLADR